MQEIEPLPDDYAICLVGHGTRDINGVIEFLALSSKLKDREPDRVIECGFLGLAEPTFEEVIAKLVQDGINNIVLIPGLLITASHARKDIPDKVIKLKRKYPALNIKYGRPLGIHPKILKVCSERIETAESNSIFSIARAETLLMTVAHGSTDPDANSTTEKVSQMLRKSMDFGGSETSFIGANQPLLSEALEASIKMGFKRIIVFPYFLFNGVLTKRIAAIVDDMKKKYPEVELLKAQYLNYHELIIDVFLERAREAPFEL
ncbi:MAG: precorrin-8X/cobalt-precorrin-8 methylmutase [Nitrospinales bacterium]|jgi:precorrin-8X/cobalt-precorrin-8 methylmutase